MRKTDFLSENMFVAGKQMEDGGNQPPGRRFKACPVSAAGAMEAERGGGGRGVAGTYSRCGWCSGVAQQSTNDVTLGRRREGSGEADQ